MPTDVAPHNMTASNAPSPYVASASSFFPTLDPFRAFDGLTNGYWVTNGTNTGWIKIDLGSGNTYTIGTYAVRVNTIPEPNRAPQDWTLQGSNDDSSYTVIDTVTGQTSWGNGETRTFTCDDTSTAYRYFKVDITANNGDTFLQMEELFLYLAAATGGRILTVSSLNGLGSGGSLFTNRLG